MVACLGVSYYGKLYLVNERAVPLLYQLALPSPNFAGD